MPQERMDARLQKQAKFINQFGEGLIWNNVIIVAKQPGVIMYYQRTTIYTTYHSDSKNLL